MQLFFKNEDGLYVLIQKDLQNILLKKKHKTKKKCVLYASLYIQREEKQELFLHLLI